MLLTKSVQVAREKSLKSIVYNIVVNNDDVKITVFPTLEPCSVFGNSTKIKTIYIFCPIHILGI